MNGALRILLFSSFLALFGVTAYAATITNFADQKTEAEVKKIRVERIKALVDVATNKTLLVGLAIIVGGPIAVQLGRCVGTRFGQISAHSKAIEEHFLRCFKAQLNRDEKISTTDAMETCHNSTVTLADIIQLEDENAKNQLKREAGRKLVDRCLIAYQTKSTTDKQVQREAYCLNATPEQVAHLEDDATTTIEQRKLMGPVDAYWDLGIKDKGKHLGYKIAHGGGEGIVKGIAGVFTFTWLFNKS